MVIKEGETAPSANPSRKRTAANPAKFLGAARHMHIIPQMNLVSSASTFLKKKKMCDFRAYTVVPTNLLIWSRDMR
jgi:hypothetical protein